MQINALISTFIFKIVVVDLKIFLFNNDKIKTTSEIKSQY